MNTSLKTAAYRATIALIAGALPAIASAADFLPLGEGVLPSGKYVQDYKYTLYPGEGVPWHYHPGPVYVVVIGGTITEDEGCGKPLNTYTVGTAFSEAPRAIHQVFNHGTEPVVIIVTAIVPPRYAGYTGNIFVNGPRCDDDGDKSERD